jgi:hypothetical protein
MSAAVMTVVAKKTILFTWEKYSRNCLINAVIDHFSLNCLVLSLLKNKAFMGSGLENLMTKEFPF